MDAISSSEPAWNPSDLGPVLIAGSSEAARRRAEFVISCAGPRIAAVVPIEAARERIERQGRAGAVWLEVDEDCGGALDDLLQVISRDVEEKRYAAVVSTTANLIDPVFAGSAGDGIDLLVNASDADRISALAVALGTQNLPVGASDVASDRNAERLRQLSEEVSRIASTLARLSTGPAPAPPAVEPRSDTEAPAVSAETVRSVIRARRTRARYFSEELFADPAWDMLLDLFHAEIAQLRVPVSSLCIAASVPATTALRWLKTMVADGLFIRRADPHDGRRIFVELAPAASDALRRYFAEIGPVPVV